MYSGCPLYVSACAVFAFSKYAVRVTSCVCASCALTTNGVRVTSCVCTTIGLQGASRVHPTTKRGQRVSYMCKQRVHVELRTMCKLRVRVARAASTASSADDGQLGVLVGWFEHWLGEFSDRSVSVGYVHNFDLLFRLGGWFSLWLSSRFVRCTHMTRNKYKSCGVQEWIRRVPKVCAGGLNYARAGYVRVQPPAIVHVLDFAYKHSNDVNKA